MQNGQSHAAESFADGLAFVYTSFISFLKPKRFRRLFATKTFCVLQILHLAGPLTAHVRTPHFKRRPESALYYHLRLLRLLKNLRRRPTDQEAFNQGPLPILTFQSLQKLLNCTKILQRVAENPSRPAFMETNNEYNFPLGLSALLKICLFEGSMLKKS